MREHGIIIPVTRWQERMQARQARRARIVEHVGNGVLHAIAWSMVAVFALALMGVIP